MLKSTTGINKLLLIASLSLLLIHIPLVSHSAPQPASHPGLFSPTPSTFFLRNTNTAGYADITFSYGPANAGWRPISGDWNGDGKDTIGLYDPKTAKFYLRNTNTAGYADITFPYGWVGNLTPVAGDWDGNGTDTIGLYNPVTSIFYLRNTNSGGYADITFAYGPANAGWIPISGDWNGDGKDTIGLYDPKAAKFYLRNTNTSGIADITFPYGWVGNLTPVAGDWDGNGTDTIGLYNPATSIFYLRNTNSAGYADITFAYGAANAGWKPIMGNWNTYPTPIDTTPPTGTIKINNDAASTPTSNVTLNLSAVDTGSGMGTGAQMQFSNDNIVWSTPQAYATTKAWTLTAGNGQKTIYVKFKDVANNWSIAYSDSITLNVVTLSISVNPKLWSIGSTGINQTVTMTQAARITITNNGSGPEVLALKLTNPAGWTASTQPGSETYVLSGLLCNMTDIPQASHFNKDASMEDVITTQSKSATSTVFGYSQATANGASMPAGSARSLYLQFKSPTITQKTTEQIISVTISCQVP